MAQGAGVTNAAGGAPAEHSPEAVRAKEAAALPEHVIKQFGKPPAVPTGPLNAEIEAAIDTAFIKSVQQSDWLEEKSDALVRI